MTELAKRIGVAPQQLYPIARRLASEGTIIKREGGGYMPAAAGSASPSGEPTATKA